MKRQNHCGAGMATTLFVRLLAGFKSLSAHPARLSRVAEVGELDSEGPRADSSTRSQRISVHVGCWVAVVLLIPLLGQLGYTPPNDWGDTTRLDLYISC